MIKQNKGGAIVNVSSVAVKIEGGIVSGKVTSPQNRVARAEEVADVILFLSSPEASNVTGIFMPVDGGFTAF